MKSLGLRIRGDDTTHAVTTDPNRARPGWLYVVGDRTHCRIDLNRLARDSVRIVKDEPDCPLCLLTGNSGSPHRNISLEAPAGDRVPVGV